MPLLSAPLVRPARESDARDVLALLDAEALEASFDAREFVVAEDAGRVVACARLRTFPTGAHELASVAVAPERRGSGLGARLVRATLARATGPVHALAVAPGFFERLGFARIPAPPPELHAKASGFCASKGFVPMTLLSQIAPEGGR